jgi:hypothetical protein
VKRDRLDTSREAAVALRHDSGEERLETFGDDLHLRGKRAEPGEDERPGEVDGRVLAVLVRHDDRMNLRERGGRRCVERRVRSALGKLERAGLREPLEFEDLEEEERPDRAGVPAKLRPLVVKQHRRVLLRRAECARVPGVENGRDERACARNVRPHCPEEDLEHDELLAHVLLRPARSRTRVARERRRRRRTRLARVLVQERGYERGAVGDDAGEKRARDAVCGVGRLFVRAVERNERAEE